MPQRTTRRSAKALPATTPASEIDDRVDSFSAGLNEYLRTLGLPTGDVLVNPGERMRVIANLPAITSTLSAEHRNQAYYISKFVAACGAGLFDAALNFLWNETISNLREKVAQFDLEYFLDSTVTDSARRAALKSPDDLPKLDDWELIRGCMETGILTDVGFKHLDYIRNMRNYASAAHPNQNQMTGFQLVAWLETCIREVLSKEPQGGVVEVRKLLRSLRNESLQEAHVEPIATSLQRLPDELARSLLRAAFGMFTDPSAPATVRNNILLVAPAMWGTAPDDSRHEVGLKHEAFSVNGEAARRSLAHQFLEAVEGLSYLPSSALAVEIGTAVENLSAAHNGYNNFYNEPPHARALARLVPATGRIPQAVERDYVKVLLMCRLGNGYGVSEAARPVYDELIQRWSERHVLQYLQLLAQDPEIASRLQFDLCRLNLKELATDLRMRVANKLVQRAIDVIAGATPEEMGQLGRVRRFRQAVKDLPS